MECLRVIYRFFVPSYAFDEQGNVVYSVDGTQTKIEKSQRTKDPYSEALGEMENHASA